MAEKIPNSNNQSPQSQGTGRESAIYERRFSSSADQVRQQTWRILCRDFFQQFIPFDSTVLDIGAGDGNFIANIESRRKIAVDISPHVMALKEKGVDVILTVPATEFAKHLKEKVDVVFMSNFLEHLESTRFVLDVFEQCRDCLKQNGKVLILQPNIRYVGAKYWDYIDHHIALTETSLTEALDVTGFKVTKLIPRFLPYTVKSYSGNISARFPKLVELYLKYPILWRLFGEQTFVIAERA